MAAYLCSGGWNESLGIVVSVVVGFRCVLEVTLSVFLCPVMSKELILLSVSFSYRKCHCRFYIF